MNVFVESGARYLPEFEHLPDGSYLVGYWQSFKYFESIAARIACDLIPREELSPPFRAIRDRAQQEESVAIHVRRGDYVTLSSAATWHGVQPLSYYREAVVRVRNATQVPRFYVFSDDPGWCAANMPLGAGEMTIVTGDVGEKPWEHLILMSHCRHHVIANSSFSWWGAWLADQRLADPKRVVIAPVRWFRSGLEGLNDRIPPHWITL